MRGQGTRVLGPGSVAMAMAAVGHSPVAGSRRSFERWPSLGAPAGAAPDAERSGAVVVSIDRGAT